MNWYTNKGEHWEVVISSRIRLARNLQTYNFPNQLPVNEKERLRQEIFAVLTKLLDGKEEFLSLKLESFPTIDRKDLVEKHLISEDLAKGEVGQGLFIAKDESLSIMINEEDHLRLQVFGAGLCLDAVYQKAEKVAVKLEKGLPIAYDSNLGFLTSCPTNTGTGMRASVLVHLPAICKAGRLKFLIQKLKQSGFDVRGHLGENSEPTGYLFQLSNQITLGISEKDTLLSFNKLIREVMALEKSLRQELFKISPLIFEDQIYRSYGQLLMARNMPYEEAMKRISDVRLGISLGVLTEQNEEIMAQIVAAIGEASLQKSSGEEIIPELVDAYRAKKIKQLLEPGHYSR